MGSEGWALSLKVFCTLVIAVDQGSRTKMGEGWHWRNETGRNEERAVGRAELKD